jgi:hypothetical protein
MLVLGSWKTREVVWLEGYSNKGLCDTKGQWCSFVESGSIKNYFIQSCLIERCSYES